EYRVVLQQMSQGFRVRDVIDRYDFNSRVVERRTQQVPSNAPKAIDSNLNRHKYSSVVHNYWIDSKQESYAGCQELSKPGAARDSRESKVETRKGRYRKMRGPVPWSCLCP